MATIFVQRIIQYVHEIVSRAPVLTGDKTDTERLGCTYLFPAMYALSIFVVPHNYKICFVFICLHVL